MWKKRHIKSNKFLPVLFIFLTTQFLTTQVIKSLADINEKKRHWVEFYQQKITISCEDGFAKVEGIYYLRNLTHGMISMKIQYPFHIDEYHPFPHKVYVDEYPFQKDSLNIYFNLYLRPKEEKSFRILYSQYHWNKTVRYPLSAIQSLGDPIQLLEFVMIMPTHWNVTLSHKADKWEFKKGKKIYYLTKYNFFPKEDLLISWK